RRRPRSRKRQSHGGCGSHARRRECRRANRAAGARSESTGRSRERILRPKGIQDIKRGGSVADLSREQLQRLARLGAKARVEELRREEAAIRRAFPDAAGGARPAESRRRRRRRRGGMSAAARRAASERMKRYWAERR